MTVGITLLDANTTFLIGGTPDQAFALRARLAALMKRPVEGNKLLHLALETQDFETRVMPILDEFSDLGWCPADDAGRPIDVKPYAEPNIPDESRPTLITTPQGERVSVKSSPWREFALVFGNDIPVTETLTEAICRLVDVAYQQAQAWDLPKTGAILTNWQPPLVVTVNPVEHRVDIDRLPDDVELPTQLWSTPYGNQRVQ
jgi:hypothetical protein